MKEIKHTFEHDLLACSSLKDVEALKIAYLGRKGIIQEKMQQLRALPPEQKKEAGAKINALKQEIEHQLSLFSTRLENEELQRRFEEEKIDMTLPGRLLACGSAHPVTEAIEKIVSIFKEAGFSVQTGPQIDTDYFNFDSLNFAEDHPAKDMQDTFYVEPGVLLRTHTSNVWGHVLGKSAPPIRIVCPGKCFRSETISARAHMFFHQIEILAIDEGLTMRDLVWTLHYFFEKFFSQKVELRFRPSYFPFVEPGVEVDIACVMCQGKGCPICKHSGWLEVLGAGMVHPQVLRNFGVDPEKQSGFAAGFGIERLVMMLHEVKDLRLFAQNDMRLLRQLCYV